jgi:predicted Zn-dependent peptidase
VVAFASRDEDLPVLESSMLALFDDLREGRLDQDALRRAQTKLQLDWDQIRSSRGLLSFHLGHFQVMDRWNTLQTFMDVRQRATIADIQRVARRYFVPANRIIATTRRRADGSFSGTAAGASR